MRQLSVYYLYVQHTGNSVFGIQTCASYLCPQCQGEQPSDNTTLYNGLNLCVLLISLVLNNSLY